MFIPHFGCETPEQLERFIDLVQEKLIFKKFYTLPIIQDMFKQLEKNDIVVPENIEFKNFMDDYGHRNQESIQNLAIEYLKLVLDISRIQNQPELVKKFCNMSVINKPIDINDFVNLSTQFDGQTFISCTNPLELMHSKFDHHIEKIKDELKIRSFKDLYNKYLRTIEDNTKRVESLQKSGTKTSHSNEEMTKLDYERMYAEMSEHVEIPKIPSNLLPSLYGKEEKSIILKNDKIKYIPFSTIKNWHIRDWNGVSVLIQQYLQGTYHREPTVPL
jgi:hypothetical protein